MTENISEDAIRPLFERNNSHEEEYVWRKPTPLRRRSLSHPRSHPTSRRTSPEKYSLDGPKDMCHDEQYMQVLGFAAEFLAGMLCPQRAMCNQKFELVVDELVFIGHPVCADPDGTWRFKQEKAKVIPRGRGSKKGQSPQAEDKPLTPEKNGEPKRPPQDSWLQTFHFVFVFDLPDPSSSQSGNISKYFDTIYEQMAFTITAILYQEQILHNYVETECDLLGTLENEHIDKGALYCFLSIDEH